MSDTPSKPTPEQEVIAAARDLYRIWNPPLSADAQDIVMRSRAWSRLQDALADAGLLP